MRLFRRSLLCLVVGVTAFGAAGWALRPRANWAIECGVADAEDRLLNPAQAPAVDEAIWIRRTVRTNGEPVDSLLVLDPRSGEVRRSWLLSYSEGRHDQYFGAPGQLIAMCSGDGTTKFRVFDAHTGAVVERELPTYWAPGGSGTSAWRFEQRAEEDILHIVDLVTGDRTSRTLKPPAGRLFGRQPFGDLSPDARQFAARLLNPGGGSKEPTFQIWRLDPPALIHEVIPPLPENTVSGEIDSVRWMDAGRLVEVTVSSWNQPDDRPHQHEQWHYELASKRIFSPPAPPAKQRHRWLPVPSSDAEVVMGYELSPLSLVPAALLERLPDAWRETGGYQMRWRDRRTNASHDVGCRDVLSDPQIRADSVITLCESATRKRTLESWPLPPRDPKWPSLFIAMACAAATWRLCAWRYRRRMKQVMNEAVAM